MNESSMTIRAAQIVGCLLCMCVGSPLTSRSSLQGIAGGGACSFGTASNCA